MPISALLTLTLPYRHSEGPPLVLAEKAGSGLLTEILFPIDAEGVT